MTNKKSYKILIVEDETIIAEDLKMFLEDNGYEIVGVVNSGSEALEMHKTLDPDLVLMDIVLDETMNGIEAANQMQDLKPTPIIFLTALKNDVVLKNVKNVNSFIHILKPFRDSELIKSIEKMLTDEQLEKEESCCKKKLELMLDHISDGIIILSSNGNLSYSNKAIQQLFGDKSNDFFKEVLYYFSNVNKEEVIELELSDRKIPCLVKSVSLNWNEDYDKMIVIKDLSQERELTAKIEKYQADRKILEKKYGIGTFLIDSNETPKMLDANPAFLKKLKFEQFSDLHTKSFLDLLQNKKDFQLIQKKLVKDNEINDFQLDLIDQKGNHLSAELNAKLSKKENSTAQIEGILHFKN